MRGVVFGWWPLRGLSGAGKGTRRHVQNRLCPTPTTRTSFSDALRCPIGNQLICRRRFAISSTTASLKQDGASTTSTSKNRILLVDGNALVYRAYWGYHYISLNNAGGGQHGPGIEKEPGSPEVVDTSSLFGFLRMLLVLLEIRPVPKYVSIVFDSRQKTFRHQIYEEYKNNRQPTPDDLREEVFPRVKDLVRAMQLNMIEVPGYEADDVIGSICRSALDQRAACLDAKDYCQIDLATPDKDFFQLLGPEVRMLRPQKKNRESSVNGIAYDVYSERTFAEDFGGLSPQKFIDIQALAGDSADNVPGVRGIGPKTAVKLLLEYENLQSIIENASSIKGKVARNALTSEEGVSLANLSRRLVELDCTIPDDVLFQDDLERDLLFARPSDGGQELLNLFEEYEFKTLVPRVEALWSEIDASGVARDGEAALSSGESSV
ncbi:5'-3' exonuclease resolvase domain of DNA polymerase I [Chloropicon roscoffensis]|uniref:5'-3' exonuclease resolvase domain of DNA polymerase I n=1 Tax=Chloropicon roscoffensis TaxID=1461544 RepID=A0AAX4PNQ7_9CHLO